MPPATITPRMDRLILTAGEHILPGVPTADATKALLRIGDPLVGGNAAGTWIGGNVPAAFAGDLVAFQRNGERTFQLTPEGSLFLREAANDAGLPPTGSAGKLFGALFGLQATVSPPPGVQYCPIVNWITQDSGGNTTLLQNRLNCTTPSGTVESLYAHSNVIYHTGGAAVTLAVAIEGQAQNRGAGSFVDAVGILGVAGPMADGVVTNCSGVRGILEMASGGGDMTKGAMITGKFQRSSGSVGTLRGLELETVNGAPINNTEAIYIGPQWDQGILTRYAIKSETSNPSLFSGPAIIKLLGSEPASADLIPASYEAWLNEGTNTLEFFVKYADGSTIKRGELALA